MYVWMMLKVLSPSVEHAEKPDLRAEVFGVAGKFEQRSGTGAEEQVIKQTLVLQDESGELVRQGEDVVTAGVEHRSEARPDVALLVSKDWEAVGIKTIVQIRERALHFKMNENNELMAEIWNEDTSAFPYTGNAKADPRNAPILTMEPLWRRWYATGGKEGAEPPPEMKRIVEIVDKARTVGPDEQVKLSQELYRNWAENVYEIGTIGLTPMVQGVVVTGAKFRNVPTTLGNDWPLRSPGNARTEQFFFAK